MGNEREKRRHLNRGVLLLALWGGGACSADAMMPDQWHHRLALRERRTPSDTVGMAKWSRVGDSMQPAMGVDKQRGHFAVGEDARKNKGAGPCSGRS